jgi:hypothetical protein
MKILEENRPWWGVRTSNPGEAASLSRVGSTPALFRHFNDLSMTLACTTDIDDGWSKLLLRSARSPC